MTGKISFDGTRISNQRGSHRRVPIWELELQLRTADETALLGYPGNCYSCVAFRIRPDLTPAISRQTNAAGRRDFDIGSNQDRRQTFFSVFRRITPSSPFAASESLRVAETATAGPSS